MRPAFQSLLRFLSYWISTCHIDLPSRFYFTEILLFQPNTVEKITAFSTELLGRATFSKAEVWSMKLEATSQSFEYLWIAGWQSSVRRGGTTVTHNASDVAGVTPKSDEASSCLELWFADVQWWWFIRMSFLLVARHVEWGNKGMGHASAICCIAWATIRLHLFIKSAWTGEA